MDNSIMQFLVSLREQYSLTQAEMAARLNVSADQVMSWERGDSFPSQAALKNISEMFNVPPNALPKPPINDSYIRINTGESDGPLGMSQHDFLCWLSRCYPIIVTIIYLLFGFLFDLWHPGWIIFLTIPLFYTYYYTMKDKL